MRFSQYAIPFTPLTIPYNVIAADDHARFGSRAPVVPLKPASVACECETYNLDSGRNGSSVTWGL